MSKEIYVGNPNGADVQAILRHLSERYGPVVDAETKPTFCFVTFSNAEAARHAVHDGQMVVGMKRVSLERRRTERSSQPSSSASASNTRSRDEPSRNASSGRSGYGGGSSNAGSSRNMMKTMYAVYADNVPSAVAMVELQDYFRKCGAESVNWDTSADGRNSIKILFTRENDAQRLLDERAITFQGRQLYVRSHAAPRPRSPQPVPPPPIFNDPTDGGSDRRRSEDSSRGPAPASSSRVNALRSVESILDSIKSSGLRYKAEDAYANEPSPSGGPQMASGSSSSRGLLDEFGRRMAPNQNAIPNDPHYQMASTAAAIEIDALREQLRQQKEMFEQQAMLHREQRSLMEDMKSKLAKAEAEELVMKRDMDEVKAENNRLTRDLQKANSYVDEFRDKCKKLSDENFENKDTIQALKQENHTLREGIERLETDFKSMVANDQQRRDEPMPREYPRGSQPQGYVPANDSEYADIDAMRRTIEELAVLRDALKDDALFDSLAPAPKRPLLDTPMGDGLLPPPGPSGGGLLGPGPAPMMGGVPSLLNMPRVRPPPAGLLSSASSRGGRRDDRKAPRGIGGRPDNRRRTEVGRRGDRDADSRPRERGGRDNRRR